MKKQKFTNFFAAYKDYFYSILTAIIICVIMFAATFIMREQLDAPKSNPKNEAVQTFPKYDSDNNPIYIESGVQYYATNTFLNTHRGEFVDLSGRLSGITEDGDKLVMCFRFDDTYSEKSCSSDLIIFTNQHLGLKTGDYVKVTGYIDRLVSESTFFDNNRGDVLAITATKIEKSTYDDIFHPTIVIPENQTITDAGLTIKIDKIEFTKDETRIYITADNNSSKNRDLPYYSNSYIIQNRKQMKGTNDNLSYQIKPGVTESGVIKFKNIEQTDFRLTFDNIKVFDYKFDYAISI